MVPGTIIYSYYIFLVHHVIIYILTPKIIPYMTNIFSVIGMFAFQIVVMVIFAFIVKLLSKLVGMFLK